MSFAHSVPASTYMFYTVSFGHSVPSTQYAQVLYSVLWIWSLRSIHRVHTGYIQCPLFTMFHPPSVHRFYTVSFTHSVPASTYRFYTVSFGHSVPSSQYTQALYSVLWSLFYPPSTHRLYTVSFGHCSIRPVHTDLRQCSVITQFQYTHLHFRSIALHSVH